MNRETLGTLSAELTANNMGMEKLEEAAKYLSLALHRYFTPLIPEEHPGIDERYLASLSLMFEGTFHLSVLNILLKANVGSSLELYARSNKDFDKEAAYQAFKKAHDALLLEHLPFLRMENNTKAAEDYFTDRDNRN